MPRQQLFSPANAFIQGRAAGQQFRANEQRNALAQMELDNAPAAMERRNRLADLQVEGAQMGIDAERAKVGYARLKQALDSGNPKAYVLQREPELVAKLQQQGVDLASLDDQQAAQIIDGFAREYAGKAGIVPTAQMETIQTDAGGILQRDPTTGELRQVVAPQKPDRFYEQQAAADRRAREQREFLAEQNRLNREAAAAKSANTVAESEQAKQRTWDVYSTARDALMSSMSATETGPLAGRLPAVTANQQAAEGAVAAMAPVLKQLFRSAGEGVFTDRDQQLLLDMVPKRTDKPEARRAKMENIDAIVRAKLGMQAQSPQQQTQEITATGPNGQKLVLRNGQWVPM